MRRPAAVVLLLASACLARREAAPTGRLQELIAARRGPEVVERGRIRPGDVVEVRIEGRSEASRAYTVSRKGAIRLPGAGETEIAEKSESEAAAEIGWALGAEARVRVVEVTGGEVRIAGAVEQPGTLRLGSKGRTLLDALAVAGGLSETASGTIRLTPGSLAAGEEPIDIAADAVLRGGKKGPGGLHLRAGDRIDVLSADGDLAPMAGRDPVAELAFATADVPDDEDFRELDEPREALAAHRPPEPAVALPAPTPERDDSVERERRVREVLEARAEAERARRETELERRRREELSVRLAELEASRARSEAEPEPMVEPTRPPSPLPTRAPMPTVPPVPTHRPEPPPPPRVSSPSSRIAVIGRVRSPGIQRLGEGRTVTRAVLRAGLAEGADVTRIEIRRDDGVRSSTVRVNLLEVRAGRSPDLLLEAGDTIIVP